MTEFETWKHDVASACADLPDDATLMIMFDDGLEPEDVADPNVRQRYRKPERRVRNSDNLAHLVDRLSAAE